MFSNLLQRQLPRTADIDIICVHPGEVKTNVVCLLTQFPTGTAYYDRKETALLASWIVVGIPLGRIASVLLFALGLGGDQESVDSTLETKRQLTCVLNWL